MDIYIKDLREKDSVCDTLILPVTEGDAGLYDRLLPTVSPLIKKIFSREFKGKKNEVFLIPCPGDIKPERILLIGLGKKAEVSAEGVRQAGGKAALYLRDLGMKKVSLSTGVISDLKFSPLDFMEGALLGLYTYKRYKEENNNKSLDRITILSRPSKDLKKGLDWLRILTDAVCLARDLVNAPSNDMTPSDLARTALSLRRKDLSVKVIERKEAQRLGMGAYLSVAKGSHEPPKFIVLQYRGSKGAPVVLVGKSITFDSGGISIKPADGLEKMKYDMAGGAAVLGVIKAAAESGMKRHIIGILPATENLPGGSASKPGDVVKAITGKTVEIINTDAEGRLVMADALGYAKRFKPRAVIDIATLTGACSIALGNEAMAMMGNDRALLDAVRRSSENVYERVWEMPLFEEYKEYIKSDIAEIKNTGGRTASLVTSACFLNEFTADMP
ncbi:MAG: leucyl aminopeptidase, partial [Nitrospirae bacterium]|nr:leucyl aminopeptidase [Nitrospirota bacterium]